VAEGRRLTGIRGVNSGAAALLRFGRLSTDFSVRVLRGLAWPKAELAIRLWLAQIFFVSGVLKLTHWDTALYLAAHEYPVSWLSAGTAATIGVSIEVIGGALLALGFMARYAAAPMLALALVAQFAYLPFDNQLFWAALFGWYVLCGAGPISVDSLLRRGLADSALPIIPRIVNFTETLRNRCGPVYLSAVRVWLGAALLLAVLRPDAAHRDSGAGVAAWLPIMTASHVPAIEALIGGALLLLGLGARYTAAALIIALSVGGMMDPRMSDTVYLLMLCAIFVIFGAGQWSLDALIARLLAKKFPPFDTRRRYAEDGAPRVVIVGAGFGGMSCAAALRTARASVTLVDRTNYHLFQPLLYQVATAALSPGDIAAPVRALFRDSLDTRILLGKVSGVNTSAQVVTVDDTEIPYDFLVLATGATHSYFGKDHWAPYAPGLKRVEDAIEIRRRILTAFEHAEASVDGTERDALLTFLIVGGGPTGVELAGAIAELARFGMEKEFRNFDPAEARVILVQSAPRLLPAFPESLAAIARRSLEKLGVEVQTGSRVEAIDAEGVTVSGKRIVAKTVLWAAGVTASPAAKWLGAAADNAGRVKVAADLSVPGHPNVYAIGDTAASNAWKGQAVPGLAPAAKQGGAYVARQIRAKLEGRTPPPAFAYRHLGSLATIGRKAAVADFTFIKLWGAPAWWLWGMVHIGFLLGVRNRVATMVNWFWAYLTFRGGIRLITGGDAVAVAPRIGAQRNVEPGPS
jgi:NADH dehydrogenase/putative oxidoreductase